MPRHRMLARRVAIQRVFAPVATHFPWRLRRRIWRFHDGFPAIAASSLHAVPDFDARPEDMAPCHECGSAGSWYPWGTLWYAACGAHAPNYVMAAGVLMDVNGFVLTLLNGWRIVVPWSVTPLLEDAALRDRLAICLYRDRIGIHWPRLDEDLSVRGLLRTFGAVPP